MKCEGKVEPKENTVKRQRTTLGGEKALPPPPPGVQPVAQQGTPANAAEDPNKKKKGLFGKIAGIFKDDKPSNEPPPKPPDDSGKGPQ